MSDDIEHKESSSYIPIRLRNALDLHELTSDKEAELCFDATDSENLTPFELMALEMEDITPTKDGGVLKKVLKQGTGKVAPDKSIARVHYIGYIEYSDEPYDSSRLRNRQVQFIVGKGERIAGWDVAVSTMRKGEVSRFLVSPVYAYGELGRPPRIPPNSTIMYEIELISFVDHAAADAYANFTKEERELASVNLLMEVARAERQLGDEFFHQDMFTKAMRKYKKALSVIENTCLKNEEEEMMYMWQNIMVTLCLNLALCCLKLAKSPPAITYCRKVLKLDPYNAKAFFRLGQAYMQLAEFGSSRDYLLKANQLAPHNEEVQQELAKLNNRLQRYRAIDKIVYTRMYPDDTKKEETT